ncbi:hypothetical protein D9Q98_000063 [Chlorella vulgaris]|uniref:Uncharacterized protein n=1 Tax=Chlorella vulgaris TaxID=3077 RepID=A0A9D4TYL2_CHLVU|nr:hypothetical protein D9Q98_000063 [Chlorella vulgaris]
MHATRIQLDCASSFRHPARCSSSVLAHAATPAITRGCTPCRQPLPSSLSTPPPPRLRLAAARSSSSSCCGVRCGAAVGGGTGGEYPGEQDPAYVDVQPVGVDDGSGPRQEQQQQQQQQQQFDDDPDRAWVEDSPNKAIWLFRFVVTKVVGTFRFIWEALLLIPQLHSPDLPFILRRTVQVIIAVVLFLAYVAAVDWVFGHIPGLIARSQANAGWGRRAAVAAVAALRQLLGTAWRRVIGALYW